MITRRLVYFLLAFIPFTGIIGQEAQNLTLSIDEAKEYAVDHNKSLKASRLDVKAAEMAKWDVISNGLPRVDASGALNDNLKLMTTLLPGEIVGQPAGTYRPVQFGTKYNTNYGVQATQLIFSAPYLVGIQMASLAEKMQGGIVEKSEQDIRESVVTTYYLILISEESLSTINGNLENLREVLKSTEAMYSVGMAEVTDVDQMKSTLTMVENSKRSIERNIEFTYNLLRFQLGLDVDAGISLSTTLDDIIATADVESILGQKFNHQSNIDFRLMMLQESMSALTLKSTKASVLPSLSGFYSWSKNGMGNKLSDLQWFPNSMLGFQLNIPIFASGQRYSRIRKAQFELEKAKVNREMIADNLLLQEKQLRFNLISAKEQYDSQRDNVEVAKRVYESVNNKYREGMASSLDLTQAHDNLLTAENNHASALLNLIQTKLAFEKLLNNF